MNRPSTAQRDLLLRLMREAEFDTRTITYQHRRLGAADHEIGGSVDAWLDSLSAGQVSGLIDKLQAELA